MEREDQTNDQQKLQFQVFKRVIFYIFFIKMVNQYQSVFKAFDDKNQGVLRKAEAADAIRCCGFNPSDAQIRQAMKG